MSCVTIKLLDETKLGSVFFSEDTLATIRGYHQAGYYTSCRPFWIELNGEVAAEEAFDLTNNPSRQYERNSIYGNGRSVSSGDIVNVDGVDYACLSIGWAQLPN